MAAVVRSELFQAYRTVGYVCDETPVHVKRLGTETFVTVAIGRSWQVFNAESLTVSLVSPRAESHITSLTTVRDMTFTAVGREIHVWKRTARVAVLDDHMAPILMVHLIGDTLVSIDVEGAALVWDCATGGNTDELGAHAEELLREEAHGEDEALADPLPLNEKSKNQFPLVRRIQLRSGVRVSAVVHPPTYLNKLLVAYSDGTMELWNLRTSKLLYTFDSAKWGGDGKRSPVTAAVAAPAPDIVAAGLADGRVVLLNIRFDEVVRTFKHTDGAVSAISFRTDGKAATMITGSTEGHISVWDLDENRLSSMISRAHSGPVISLHFLVSEPVFVSSGTDNCLKMWIFDLPDRSARLLKSRDGHAEPLTRVRFRGTTVLTASRDRSLRVMSVMRDQLSTELSQGHLKSEAARKGTAVENLRLPAVVDLCVSNAKEREWANVLSCHAGVSAAITWSTDSMKVGKHRLVHKQRPRANVTSVCISACGNFGVIGTEDGRVERYNMQSGFFRGSYGHEDQTVSVGVTKWAHVSKPPPKRAKKGRDASDANGSSRSENHEGPIHGLASDGLNRWLISAGYDGTMRFWDFTSRELFHVLDLGSPVSQLIYSRDSDLAAVCTDDLLVRVVDCSARRVVRQFSGHTGRVSDMAFSPDSRWLVTACMDGSVRVFDLPSSRLVDWMTFEQAVTSLSFSPNGDFLATTHAENLGVFLWANRSYFSSVFLRSVAEVGPVNMDMPGASVRGRASAATPYSAGEVSKAEEDLRRAAERRARLFDDVGFAPRPLEGAQLEHAELLTMSALPRSRWQVLPHLDIIKERNKPVSMPKAPPQAPFFLGTVLTSPSGPEFDVDQARAEYEASLSKPAEPNSHLLRLQGVRPESRFLSMLKRGRDEADSLTASEDATAAAAAAAALASARAPAVGSKRPRSTRASNDGIDNGDAEDEDEDDDAEHAATLSRPYTDAMVALRSMAPAAIDAEIRMIGGAPDTEADELDAVVQFLLAQVRTGTNFDFVQAFLNVFLDVHGDALLRYPELIDKLRELGRTHQRMWTHLESLFQSNLCLVGHLSRSQVE